MLHVSLSAINVSSSATNLIHNNKHWRVEEEEVIQMLLALLDLPSQVQPSFIICITAASWGDQEPIMLGVKHRTQSPRELAM